MTRDTQISGPAIVPYFSYHDASTALDWLSKAFGFEKTQEFRAPDGSVIHAEMTFNSGVIMLGTAIPTSDVSNHPNTHGIYVCVDDVNAHYERAKLAGAQIVYAPEQTEWGTLRYRVLDPEGYEWSFGSYRPSNNNS